MGNKQTVCGSYAQSIGQTWSIDEIQNNLPIRKLKRSKFGMVTENVLSINLSLTTNKLDKDIENCVKSWTPKQHTLKAACYSMSTQQTFLDFSQTKCILLLYIDAHFKWPAFRWFWIQFTAQKFQSFFFFKQRVWHIYGAIYNPPANGQCPISSKQATKARRMKEKPLQQKMGNVLFTHEKLYMPQWRAHMDID